MIEKCKVDNKKLNETKVPLNFFVEDENGVAQEFNMEMDSQVFLAIAQESMRRGVRVEEFIIDCLLDSMDVKDRYLITSALDNYVEADSSIELTDEFNDFGEEEDE